VGFDMIPPDMGHKTSSGPRKGLALLFPEAPTDDSNVAIKVLDDLGEWLFRHMLDHGIPVKDLGEVETCCCDFHSMVKGHYYVGHDIDHLQDSMNRKETPVLVRHQIKEARRMSLPVHYLGELNDWDGVDKARKSHYARTGEILTRC
jgi:hypothetical protein